MAADLSSSKVVVGEQPSSTKFNTFVQAAQDDVNAIGDTTKSGFTTQLWLDPAKVKQGGAVSTNVLSWNGSNWAPVAGPGAGAWTIIADSLLGAPAASFDFTSISGSFKHLLLYGYLRSTVASTGVDLWIRFNNDSAANYDGEAPEWFGTTPTMVGLETLGGTKIVGNSFMPGSSCFTDLYGTFEMLIPHYAGTANNKAASGFGMRKKGTTSTTASGDQVVNQVTGQWRSNSAINQVTLLPSSGNFETGSRVTLVGVS